MSGYRVRVSKELREFLLAKSQAQGVSPELLIERLAEWAFPTEFVSTLQIPDAPWIPDMNTIPAGVGFLAIDGGMSQRLG